MSETGVTLLADLSEDSPSGEDLELSPDFVAMERAAEGTPETQYGETINAAVPPAWKDVQALAESLLERTRDLRVLVQLAVARLHLSGPPGFAEALTQIRHQIETKWEQVHPRLDPEDDNDPTLRTNTLVRLQDPRNVLRALREFPLARTVQTGPVSWRDIAVARGHMEPEAGREKLTETFIRGVFANTDRERLRSVREGVDQAARETDAISTLFGTLAGPVLDLSNLSKQLESIQKDLLRYEPPADAPAEIAEEEVADGAAAVGPGEGQIGQRTAASRAVTARSLTSLTQREDALYLLDLVSNYFRANEPSSPVPLLIDRARRLAAMNFIDILRDLAPDGMTQAQNIAGPPPE